jgi:hypothetical protein
MALVIHDLIICIRILLLLYYLIFNLILRHQILHMYFRALIYIAVCRPPKVTTSSVCDLHKHLVNL